MLLLRLVPLLCGLLLPFQSLAQSQEPAPPLGPVTTPPLIPAPDDSERETEEGAEDRYGGYEEDEPRGEIIPPGERETYRTGSPAIRIPVGILVGTGGAILGAIPGTAIMFQDFCLDCSDGAEGVVLGFFVGVAGMALGSALAIDLVGDALDGQGRFWPTLGGVVLGSLAGILGGFAIAAGGAGESGLLVAMLGPAVGGVLAYELSDTTVRRETLAASASRPRIAPLVAVSPRGGLIGGLAGTF